MRLMTFLTEDYMSVTKPYHRNYRDIKPGKNSGYSRLAYIEDRQYAQRPDHYTRALILILDDLKSLFEYVEPSDECKPAYSYRMHALLMRTCIEIEANFKAIFSAHDFTKGNLNMSDYRKIDVTHHLSSYTVILPMWNGTSPQISPFSPWLPHRGQSVPTGVPLVWYQAYNISKHNRQNAFKYASLWNLVQAVAALLILVTSQFATTSFDAGPVLLSIGSGEFHPYESSIGDLFRIKYPNDWQDHEIYDFDWSNLKDQDGRFAKIDYAAIPS